MRLSTIRENLFETKIEDSKGKQFREFIDKYAKLKASQTKDLFVRFAKSPMKVIGKNPQSITHGDPMGVYAYPLDYVVNHPSDMNYGKDFPYIQVLKKKGRVDILQLQGLTEDRVVSMLRKAGADINLFNEIRKQWKKFTPHIFGKGEMKNKLGSAFFYTMQHRKVVDADGDLSNDLGHVLLSASEQAKRFKKLPYAGIEDRAKSYNKAVINASEPQQIVFWNHDAYDVVDTYYVDASGGKKNRDKGSNLDRDHVFKKIAGLISQEIGEKKVLRKEIKATDARYEFNSFIGDNYFLGINTRVAGVTVSRGNYYDRQFKDFADHDDTAFAILLVGPKRGVKKSFYTNVSAEEMAKEIVADYKESANPKQYPPEDYTEKAIEAKVDKHYADIRNEEKQKKVNEGNEFKSFLEKIGVNIPYDDDYFYWVLKNAVKSFHNNDISVNGKRRSASEIIKDDIMPKTNSIHTRNAKKAYPDIEDKKINEILKKIYKTIMEKVIEKKESTQDHFDFVVSRLKKSYETKNESSNFIAESVIDMI